MSPFTEKPLAEKTIEDVLLHFGETKKVARRRYRQFVKNGIDQGKRPELQGGGLVRSAGRNKSGLLGRKREDRERDDARILGSGDFACPACPVGPEDRTGVKCLPRSIRRPFNWGLCLSISLGPAPLNFHRCETAQPI